MKLSILEYMKFLGVTENSRCVVEGEQVLNSGHLILTGKLEESSDHTIKIYGLCLQSSSVKSNPHEIKGTLSLTNGVNICEMSCSCKAGNSGKCKHVSAVLVKCIREDVELMEKISQTQMQCSWISHKQIAEDKYKPMPVSEMPCFKDMPYFKDRSTRLPVDEVAIRNFFCDNLPLSAIAKHREGRRNLPSTSSGIHPCKNILPNNCRFRAVLDNACQSVIMLYLSAVEVVSVKNCCMEKISSFLEDDLDLVINIPQNSNEWKKYRKLRITGSRCYEIFTYSNKDWKTKAFKYFYPPQLNNKYVKHGLKFEGTAREMYMKISKMDVMECGMVISSSNRWLSYSPDGIIFFGDQPLYLLEIKCIFAGKTKTILEAIKNSRYIVQIDGKYTIKKNHKYYGQIQMGMAVLNLLKTAFVVFASFDNSVLIMEIDFDFEFCFNMLSKIKHNYLKNMVHHLCKK
ncbi:uncharacterized protein [Diabrotica undecimpunctata]|uniref:uncharacterized protein n=1 Tax=Diabrotica undecimpunctata TaxID=50387 RepID=UPI003B638777